MLKIAEIRKERGITQKNLADKLHIYQSNMSNWENEVTEPDIKSLVKLADVLNVTIDELVGRENYGTGNVEIIGEKLTDDESEILAVYRTLNRDGKTAFLSTVKNLATLYNAGVKIN